MSKNMSTADAPTEPSAQEIVELTIVANEMAMDDAYIDACAARNARLLERKKNRIRYLPGDSRHAQWAQGSVDQCRSRALPNQ